jgi:4-amino-4-deoxy-L-arabinose transferase-like glycosyltransferase
MRVNKEGVAYKKIKNFIESNPISLVILIAAILYIIWIWMPLGLLHSWNEAYYLERITHVAGGGSYLDGNFDNPPLFVYTLSVLSKIIGISIVAFRLFIVFCTLITTYTIYRIGLLIGNKRVGVVSSALYGFFPMTVIFSKIIQIDVFAIMLVTLSFYFVILGAKKRKWFIPSGIFLGIAAFAKIPMALVILPIFLYMYYKKIEVKYFILMIIESILVFSPWMIHVLMTKPSFLSGGTSFLSNFFGLGSMHASSAPYYQLGLISLAIIVLTFLLILFFKKRPVSPEEKTLALFSLIYSLFFVLLPNHEYYLLPVFVPLFIFLGLIYDKKGTKEKKIFFGWAKKTLIVFLISSAFFLLAKPIYEVDWQEAGDFVRENYSGNITIYSTNPRVAEYIVQQDVIWLQSTVDISTNKTIILFSNYDKLHLTGFNILQFIEEEFVIFKNFNDKIFVYGSKDLS